MFGPFIHTPPSSEHRPPTRRGSQRRGDEMRRSDGGRVNRENWPSLSQTLNVSLWIHIPNQVGTVIGDYIDVGLEGPRTPSEKVCGSI